MVMYVAFNMLKFTDLEAKWEAKLRFAAFVCFLLDVYPTVHASTPEHLPPLQMQDYDTYVVGVYERRSRGAKALENPTEENALSQEERDELTGSGRSIFFLIFVTVVREGVETAVFIGGVGASNWRSLPLPAFVGIILGLIVGLVIVRGGRRVSNSNLKWFFYGSAVFLMFVAAGFTNYATDEIESIFADQSQKNGGLIIGEPLWDLRYCCSETENGFFAIFR